MRSWITAMMCGVVIVAAVLDSKTFAGEQPSSCHRIAPRSCFSERETLPPTLTALLLTEMSRYGGQLVVGRDLDVY